jgi:HD-GYP domain-containing protein (c-di-GMP phosphodiesterase class II)
VLNERLSSDSLAPAAKARCLYEYAHAAVELAYSDQRSADGHAMIATATSAIVDYAASEKVTISLIASTIRHDPLLFTHVVNVVSYAAVFAVRLGFQPDALRDLVTAALYHDIGMMRIDSEILYRATPLTTSEWADLKKHVGYGVALVTELFPDRPTVSSMILQHHERLDGSGYPNEIVGRAISPGARIIGLTDAFEAMTNGRPYQPAKTPFATLRELATVDRGKYDQSLFEPFIQMLAGRT